MRWVTPEGSETWGNRHQTVGMRAQQMVSLLGRWLPTVPLTLLGDTASRILELGLPGAAHQSRGWPPFVWTRGSTSHPERAPGTPSVVCGLRVVGKRLPLLETIVPDPKTIWQRITGDGYGEGQRVVEIGTATARWDRSGSDPLPIRWVRTCDPEGTRPPQALFSTDHQQAAEERLLDVLKRWSRESPIEEGHAHVGLETQRPWSDLATRRTTPLLFGLDRLATLFGKARAPDGPLPLTHAAWSHQPAAPFGDVFAIVRRQLWGPFPFPTSPTDPAVVFVPRSPLARLAHAVCS